VALEAQHLDENLKLALQDLGTVLRTRGSADAATVLSSSQQDWETYRTSHCHFQEQLADGGSIGRLNFVYCLRDLAATRLKELQSVLESAVE
jgi:uncharacterized protein YecT (DUF1311 family)